MILPGKFIHIACESKMKFLKPWNVGMSSEKRNICI